MVGCATGYSYLAERIDCAWVGTDVSFQGCWQSLAVRRVPLLPSQVSSVQGQRCYEVARQAALTQFRDLTTVLGM
jgi:hypothetical protein